MAVWSRRWMLTRLASTAVTLVRQVPVGEAAILRTVVVNNTSAAATTFALYLNYAGAAATSRILGPYTIASAGELVLDDLWMPLQAPDTIHVQAGAGSALMVYVAGYQLDDT